MERSERLKNLSFQILLDLKEIFGKADIFFWIQNGLLLGLYRDGDAIEGDENDVDIGIWRRDIQKLKSVKEDLEAKNFRVRFTTNLYGSITATFKRLPCKVHLHVNCKYNEADIIYQPMDKSGKVFVFPKEVYSDFGTIEWRGEKFNCPKDVDGYLTARYGDWKTPILKKDGWDFYDNPRLNPCYKDKLYE